MLDQTMYYDIILVMCLTHTQTLAYKWRIAIHIYIAQKACHHTMWDFNTQEGCLHP